MIQLIQFEVRWIPLTEENTLQTGFRSIIISSRKFFTLVWRQVAAQKWPICWEFPARFFTKKVTKFYVLQCVLRSGHGNDLIRSALCCPDLAEHFIILWRVRSTSGKFSTALRSLVTIILIYHRPASIATIHKQKKNTWQISLNFSDLIIFTSFFFQWIKQTLAFILSYSTPSYDQNSILYL